MYDDSFQKDAWKQGEAERIARQILGVARNASRDEVKRAWRRKCLECHPDRNQDDSGAERKFLVANCAYKLLAEGIPCDMLLEDLKKETSIVLDEKYNLDNAWGLFLWWRDRFF